MKLSFRFLGCHDAFADGDAHPCFCFQAARVNPNPTLGVEYPLPGGGPNDMNAGTGTSSMANAPGGAVSTAAPTSSSLTGAECQLSALEASYTSLVTGPLSVPSQCSFTASTSGTASEPVFTIQTDTRTGSDRSSSSSSAPALSSTAMPSSGSSAGSSSSSTSATSPSGAPSSENAGSGGPNPGGLVRGTPIVPTLVAGVLVLAAIVYLMDELLDLLI